MDAIEVRSQSDEFYLLSSIRYDTEMEWRPSKQADSDLDVDFDTPLFLISYHLDRLRRAADAFGWDKAAESLSGDGALSRFRTACEEAVTNGPHPISQIRYLVNKDGDHRLEVSPIGRRPFDLLNISSRAPREFTTWPTQYAPILDIYLDPVPTPSSNFTSYKTTIRDHYNEARERARINSPSAAVEVILYNEEGKITEGSLRNIAVFRNGSWVTPPLSTGCLGGVVRSWMIKHGRVREAEIMIGELIVGEWVLISNAVEGIGLGLFRGTRH
ncbi:aminotransferase class IV-domain-containing protein [Cantharellus anzutake]|uniref:aminotransferase class IV-domain-containing protein n=1 Tax=Cantharellus anzutake TaxID=1750568 RepID=UPI0019069B6D|nr:aminotransferase class IV-domain-containing protein [Cantharellus anzutake]KAF8324312.1 aminotransferase class IV-domain-containing protein [Cantharellus anzutake]